MQGITRSLSPQQWPHTAPGSCPLLSVLQVDLTMSRELLQAAEAGQWNSRLSHCWAHLNQTHPSTKPCWHIFLGNVSKQVVTLASSTPRGCGPRTCCLPPYQRQDKPQKSTRERKSHTSCHPPFRDHSVKQRKASSLSCRRLLKSFTPRLHLFVYIYKHLRAALPS